MWRQVHFFWGDERCVPTEDLNSNYHTARELLLSHVPVPPENIHRVRTELEPELAAQDYALTLSRSAEPPLRWPRFDLVLLGLGEDGHTASLFPHTNVAAEGGDGCGPGRQRRSAGLASEPDAGGVQFRPQDRVPG